MRAFFLSLLLVALTSCDTDPIVAGEPLSRGQVEAARADFLASDVESYRIRYSINCFCPPNEVEVRVVDGAVADVSTTNYDVEPLTVPGMYDLILDAYEQNAASVHVTVSERPPRVPVAISIDYDEWIADEEIGYSVLYFDAD